MKKTMVILWLTGIFLLCLPMSWLVLIKQSPYASTNENLILMCICAPFAFLITGGISWLFYRFMKKKNVANSARNALLIFTGLVVGVTGVTAPEAAKAMERRNKYEREKNFHQEFVRDCIEAGKQEIVPVFEGDVKDPEQLVDHYCNCVYDSMYVEPEVHEIMFDARVSNEAFYEHPKVIEIRNKCRGLMMKEAMQSLSVDSL